MSERVFLIRHGETEWSVSGRHTGSTDISLTENGRATARGLASVLGRLRFTAVLTSPLTRARQTCELSGLGAQEQIDRDLQEWDYGAYEGLTTKQIQARAPGWRLFRDGCPGGEGPDEIAARVDRQIARIRAVPGDVALFAHGHLFRVYSARWIGLPVEAGSHFLLDTGAVCILSDYRGVPAIKRWNAVGVPKEELAQEPLLVSQHSG